jgi:hypothetical protein
MSEKGVFIKYFPHKGYARSVKTIADDLEKDLKCKIPDSSTRLNKFMRVYEKDWLLPEVTP